ncbi:DNA-binding protein [Rodentibacter caecimuris]|uniref:DNA-binding protein n=1 Tax=Rodentibacter caecimuris TaxID=1796644 RepID=UPI001EFC25F2|nr:MULTISPECIES: DNA-binding protein [Pasteurellaceae]MCR1838501.1 DNA-binding protein [Pasteurella caecimuris]
MEQTLTVKQAAKLLNLSYSTVFARKKEWGFFQMKSSKIWLVEKSVLEQSKKKKNNLCRDIQVGDSEKRKCRSENQKTGYGKSILPHRAEKELDALLKQLKKGSRKNITTS